MLKNNPFVKMGFCRNYMKKYIGTLVAAFLISSSITAQPDTPTGLVAKAYDHHIELNWEQNAEPNLQGYFIYVSQDGVSFTAQGYVPAPQTRYIHFIGDWNQQRFYRITAAAGQESVPTATIAATTYEMTDEELLTMVQEYTFRYFWEHGHPASGMARERNNSSYVTTGGSGFGLMALLVGIERGFITYEQGRARVRKIVDFLQGAPKFKGAFSHWMNGATGQVIPFSAQDDGGDLVETAFLMQGLLTARQYFDANEPIENELREDITTLWEGVNWNWYRKLVEPVLYWHWSPNYNFAMNFALRGFNETHITYLLAIASPVEEHNIPAQLYHTGWAGGGGYTNNSSYYGYQMGVGGYRGGPLFFSHYSYMGFDPRNKRDSYVNYFVRNTFHTLINRAHCIANPFNRVGYSADNWGLTASDDPFVGYLAHDPTNAQKDNGTIAPTAALSSMPYTPAFSIQALKYFYREQGSRLWGQYGFYDAFHLGVNWFADSYLAIDQGPIICMIENYRTGLLWDLFMQNPEINPALEAIGFVPDSTVVNGIRDQRPAIFNKLTIAPNPVREWLNLEADLAQPVSLQISMLDANGKKITVVLEPTKLGTGVHSWQTRLPELSPGLYLLLFESDQGAWVEPLAVI